MKYQKAEPQFDIGDVVSIDLHDCGRIGPGSICVIRINQDRCFYDVQFIPREDGTHPTVISNVDEAFVREWSEESA